MRRLIRRRIAAFTGVSTAVAIVCAASACRRQPEPAVLGTQAKELVNQARKLDLAGDQEAAIKQYRAALDRDPQLYDAHYGLARALDLSGAYDDARRHFARAIELAPESDKDQTLRMMGIAWTFAGNLPEASRYFGQVFDRKLNERNFAAASEQANELGRAHLELGDVNAAETWYRTGHDVAGRTADRAASQIDLADIRFAHALGRIAARRGQAAEARRQMAEVKRLLDKGGNDDQRIQYAYLAGYVDFYLGNDRSAISALSAADQKDPSVLILLGQANERLGNRDQAREYYRKVLESSSHAITSAFARPVARAKLAAGR
jgi:tetratricopeptide (TPR) repeat protein